MQWPYAVLAVDEGPVNFAGTSGTVEQSHPSRTGRGRNADVETPHDRWPRAGRICRRGRVEGETGHLRRQPVSLLLATVLDRKGPEVLCSKPYHIRPS